MNDMFSPAGMGHNNPPGPFVPEDLLAKVADFSEAAGIWLDLRDIEDNDQAERCTDFLGGAKALFKLIDDARKEQKKPHDDAAKAVQDVFRKPLETVDFAVKRVGQLQTRWLQAERAREAARKIEEQAAARKALAEAERIAAAADARNDVAGMIEAEAARKEAAKAAKAAEKPATARAGSATGAGRTISLRTTYRCEVENINHAFVALRDHPEVKEVLERLATAAVRAQQGDKVAPNGFKLIKEEKAA